LLPHLPQNLAFAGAIPLQRAQIFSAWLEKFDGELELSGANRLDGNLPACSIFRPHLPQNFAESDTIAAQRRQESFDLISSSPIL